jgi:signal transduction histidine kinase/ligand-binding sensor domain-containing protein
MLSAFMIWLRRGFWLALLACVDLTAQTESSHSAWSVRVWQSDEGLSNNNVSGVTQTADGYLWIATRTKLARFDGVKLEEFPPTLFAPEPNRGFRASAPSRDGGLWLGGDMGTLVHATAKSSKTFTPPAELAPIALQSMLEDGDGQLWIVYRGGTIARLIDGRIVPTKIARDVDVFSGSLTLDRDNRLWFSQGTVVGQWRDGQFVVLTQLPDRTAHVRITKAGIGGIWICAGTQLFHFREGGELKEVEVFETTDATRFRPTSALEDRHGALWIGTWQNGLFRYDGRSLEPVLTPDREINCLTEDREGNLWVGTAGGGLNRVQPRAIALENTGTGQPFDAVQSLCQDRRGQLWAATQNGLLVRRTDRRWEPVLNDSGEALHAVTCVTADPAGAIWFGTSNGELHRLRDGEFTQWSYPESPGAHTIRAIHAARNGDIWIAHQQPDALRRMRGGEFRSLPLPPGIRLIRAIAEDRDGNLWLGAENGGLLRVTGDNVIDETERTLPVRKTIRSFYAAPDGYLWIGYAGGGLGRLKDGRFGRVMPEHGLLDKDVSQILLDDDGWFWLGSDIGIFKVRVEALTDVLEGRAARVHCVQYGKGQGLPNLQAKFGDWPSAVKSVDGRLWLPMRTTLAIIDTSRLREDVRPPNALLKSVAVDENTVASYGGLLITQKGANLLDPALRVRLPAGHRRLDFQFTALSMVAPESLRFRYKLDGFDDAWVEANAERTASYTRLSAGNYRFRVMAGDTTGGWSQTEATLAFTVRPFFWQAWWFQGIALTIFTLIIVAMVRYVSFRRLRAQVAALQQQAALDKERTRIARDIHDDVGGSLTHMTLLLELALRERRSPDAVASRMEQGLTTARQIIKSLDETVWVVNPRNDTLAHLINYMSECSFDFLRAAGIQCQADLPVAPPDRTVSSEVRHHLFFVVKEALNNVVRHAHATAVTLRVLVSDESLSIIVGDNGQGFAEAADNAYADGLRNMRQRMAEIDGQVLIESHPGGGTILSFIYPWPAKPARSFLVSHEAAT